MQSIFILGLATLFNVLSFAVLVPVLPYSILEFGGSHFAAAAIFSIFSLCSFIVGTLWGRAGDHWGRKKILLLSVSITFLSYIWMFYADNILDIFGSRALAGLAGGWLIGAQSYVSDVLNDNERAKGMGILGACFGIGFTIGPALGGYSSQWYDGNQLYYPVIMSLCFSSICFFISILFIKEPQNKYIIIKQDNFINTLKNIYHHHYLFMILIGFFMIQFSFTITEGTLALWINDILQSGPRQVGQILAVAGIANIIIQGGLIGRLVKKFGEQKIIASGMILTMLGITIIIINHNFIGLLIAITFISSGLGLHNPASQSLISQTAQAQDKGLTLGLAQSLSSLARALGPALGGFLFQYSGLQSPYLLSITLSVIALIVFNSYRKYATTNLQSK